ncbi:sulfite exporter TauE/SafE family protein [Aquimarina brevivitae]|uniref:Urease accessory protein UreH-like transmembrane domain-containing protein n=1 Tax=Aquimarina brevivitae TaxID=323412 RepID=A0A4Q7PHP8_9FLAO|nr:sulfite exporter TauE/SafE family protein [Aquimarina brevivitae]RZS99687.1 hypothetical protein EV197_0910 [Aquimarina brevivitae]
MLLSGFILGLIGSLHCIGMCGPIAFMLPIGRNTPPLTKGLYITLYHIGRLLAYGLIGVVFGFIGKGLSLFGWQQALSISIGALMIISVASHYFVRFKSLRLLPVQTWVQRLKNTLGAQFKRKSPDTFLTTGFLNGFLPCGMIYIAVLGTLSFGNIGLSGLYLILFGLGTVPLMTLAAYLGTSLQLQSQQRLQKLIPIVVVLIGMLFIIRGLGLGIPYLSPDIPNLTTVVNANFNCSVPK